MATPDIKIFHQTPKFDLVIRTVVDSIYRLHFCEFNFIWSVAYLQHDDYNIISVDYKPLAAEPCYVQAVQNLPTVGNCTAQLIDYLIQESLFTLDNIHVIGLDNGN